MLDKETLFDSVQDTDLFQPALDLIQEEYQEDSVWKNLLQLSPSPLYELALTASRPKKKPVSIHSTLASIAFGGCVAAVLLPCSNPRMYDNGPPCIMDISLIDKPLQINLVSLLLALLQSADLCLKDRLGFQWQCTNLYDPH